MRAELKTMSRKELEKLRKDVEVALEKVEAREMKLAHDAAAKAAADYGFSLDELNNMPAAVKRSGKSGKSMSAPKYRNPADETQTWTGKGRQPEWYKAAMAEGTDPQTLEI